MKKKTENRKRLEAIYEINQGFLGLIVQRAHQCMDQFGLQADLCRKIAALSPSQRDVVATVPVLLVTVARRAIAQAKAVRDMEDVDCRTYQRIEVEAQNFAAALMTWLTQDAQQNHSLASLWLGVRGFDGEPIRSYSFGEIQTLAPHADTILKARFRNRPKVWSDLIRGAGSKDPRSRQLARLAVLPHSFPLRLWMRFGPRRKRRR